MKTLINSFVVALVALFTVSISANAQNKDGNTLEGVWIFEKYHVDGKENATLPREGLSSVKIYGKNGEYCCAQIVKDNGNGVIKVKPHEYGTYSYKNGKYMECGREGGDEAIIFTGKNSFKGRFLNRYEFWVRNTNFPEELRKHILNACKAACAGDWDVKTQTLLKNHILYKK